MLTHRFVATEVEAAWAAGIFDGEGTVLFVPTENRVVMAVNMSDRDTVDRWAGLFGTVARPVRPDKRTNKDGSRRKQMWRVTITGRAAIEDALEAFRPWLSARRIRQFETALSQIVSKRPGRRPGERRSCASYPEVSNAGAVAHRIRGEVVCDECRVRENAYAKKLYWKRKGVA